MTTTYDQALAKLKGSSENVEEIKATFPPTLKIHDKEGKNIGKYVSGVLKTRRMVSVKGKPAPVYTVTLSDTNAEATKKDGEKWVKVDVVTGNDVSFFAPRRLDRVLKEYGPGAKVLIHYDGKKPTKTPMGEVLTHMFTVHGERSGKQFIIDTSTATATPAKEAAATNGDAADKAEVPSNEDPFA